MINYTVETFRGTYEVAVECETCCRTGQTVFEGDADTLREAARRKGWLILKGGDYCPACVSVFDVVAHAKANEP